ncbi:MAG: hypothetical protein QXU93_11765 [Thermoproteus sp.]
MNSIEKLGKVALGIHFPPEDVYTLIENAILESRNRGEPRNIYELVGLLIATVMDKNYERAYGLVKRLYGARLKGSPNILAAMLAALSRQATGNLRGYLLYTATTLLTIAPSSFFAEKILEVVHDVRPDSPDCDDLCAAYMAIAFSDLFALTGFDYLYEKAWYAFGRSGRYKPVVVAWIPLKDETDLAKIEEIYRTSDIKEIERLLGPFEITLEGYVQRMERRLVVNRVSLAFRRYLETGEKKHLETMLAQTEGDNDYELKLLRGKALAILGRFEEAKREFEQVGGDLAKRAILAITVINAIMGDEVEVLWPTTTLEKLTAYVVETLRGNQPEYVEENHTIDIILNAIADIARGKKPERLTKLASVWKFKGIFDAIMNAKDKKEALKLLYFAFI